MTSTGSLECVVLDLLAKAAEERVPGLPQDDYTRHARAVWNDNLFRARFRHEYCRPDVDPDDSETTNMRIYAHRTTITEIMKAGGDVPQEIARQAVNTFVFGQP